MSVGIEHVRQFTSANAAEWAWEFELTGCDENVLFAVLHAPGASLMIVAEMEEGHVALHLDRVDRGRIDARERKFSLRKRGWRRRVNNWIARTVTVLRTRGLPRTRTR